MTSSSESQVSSRARINLSDVLYWQWHWIKNDPTTGTYLHTSILSIDLLSHFSDCQRYLFKRLRKKKNRMETTDVISSIPAATDSWWKYHYAESRQLSNDMIVILTRISYGSKDNILALSSYVQQSKIIDIIFSMKCSWTLRCSRLFWIFTWGTTTFCCACTTETWRDRSDVIKYSIITEKWSNKFNPTYSLLRPNDSLTDIPENDILRYNVYQIFQTDLPTEDEHDEQETQKHIKLHKLKNKRSLRQIWNQIN